MKNLLTRSISGLVYVVIILASLWINPLLFALISALICLFALREMRRLISGHPGFVFWDFLISLFLFMAIVSLYFTSIQKFSPILLLLVMILIFTSAIYRTSEKVKLFLLNISFSMLYIVLPLYLLNIIHLDSISKEIPFSLAVFILIWTNDTFAYLTGLAIGKHRLFERISPKKSWEGFFGGLLTTLAVAYILYIFYPTFGLIQWMLFGILTSISGVYGDFIESILKRSANIKDSGNLMPGHGGILDRIDSVLLVSPVIYIYLHLIIN